MAKLNCSRHDMCCIFFMALICQVLNAIGYFAVFDCSFSLSRADNGLWADVTRC